MRVCKVLLLLCLMQLPLQSYAEKYRSEAHGFSCEFPAAVTKSSGRTVDGLVMTYFNSIAPGNAWASIVATGFADPREAANLRTWFRDFSGGLRGSGFQTSNAQFVTFRDRPAVRFEVAGDGVTGTGYVVIDQDRFISIIGFALAEKDHSPIEPFLQSLQIIER